MGTESWLVPQASAWPLGACILTGCGEGNEMGSSLAHAHTHAHCIPPETSLPYPGSSPLSLSLFSFGERDSASTL